MTCSPQYKLHNHIAKITSWGMIDGMIFFPGDILLLGPPKEGDLLLLESHDGLSQKFARLYGNAWIAEPQKCRIMPSRWNLVGGIKGIERTLKQASFGNNKWWIKVLGREGISSLDWLNQVESQAIESIYLSEVASQIAAQDPTLSMIAATQQEDLLSCPIAKPGTIVFSPHRNELASGFVSSWALASRRNMRRKWMKRRTKLQDFYLYPIPRQTEEKELDMTSNNKIASK